MADYKGGYQIIDLSGDNIYAKAKSAFETNKPVLVYDGGIASFGNVIKSSTNFVINYIIDDKLYQATVAADNTVTKTSTEIGGGETPSSDLVVIDCSHNNDIYIRHSSEPAPVTREFFTSSQVEEVCEALSNNKLVILKNVGVVCGAGAPYNLTLINATDMYSSGNVSAYAFFFDMYSTNHNIYYISFSGTSYNVEYLINNDTLIDYSNTETKKLTDYTASDPFTAEADGYVRIFRRSAETTGSNSVYIRGTNDGQYTDLGFILYGVPNDGKDGTDSVFVKKGTQMYATMAEGSNAYISFNPIVPEVF